MITKLKSQLSALTPTQQLGILGIALVSVVLALSCVWVCRLYNDRADTRRRWKDMP